MCVRERVDAFKNVIGATTVLERIIAMWTSLMKEQGMDIDNMSTTALIDLANESSFPPDVVNEFISKDEWMHDSFQKF